jgi:hypothetical protein
MNTHVKNPATVTGGPVTTSHGLVGLQSFCSWHDWTCKHYMQCISGITANGYDKQGSSSGRHTAHIVWVEPRVVKTCTEERLQVIAMKRSWYNYLTHTLIKSFYTPSQSKSKFCVTFALHCVVTSLVCVSALHLRLVVIICTSSPFSFILVSLLPTNTKRGIPSLCHSLILSF